MKCVVCQSVRPRGVPGRQRWVFSSDRLDHSRTQLIFKLYDITRREFNQGSVCNVCHELVLQADKLNTQVLSH